MGTGTGPPVPIPPVWTISGVAYPVDEIDDLSFSFALLLMHTHSLTLLSLLLSLSSFVSTIIRSIDGMSSGNSLGKGELRDVRSPSQSVSMLCRTTQRFRGRFERPEALPRRSWRDPRYFYKRHQEDFFQVFFRAFQNTIQNLQRTVIEASSKHLRSVRRGIQCLP